MSDAYARHLTALHERFQVSDEVIRRAARVVSTRPLVAKTRIVHGEANEVYALTYRGGLEVILRIARRSNGLFEKERWAIDRCRALGIHAPAVLSVQTLESAGEALDACILEKLPGERLSDSLGLPRTTLRRVVVQLGEELSRMHTIGADDLGEGAAFFAGDTDDFPALEDEFIELASAAGLDRGVLGRAFRFYEAAVAKQAPTSRRLTHNDLRACHVVVDQGRLSGMIDFGQVSLDSPVNEFAKWDYWEAPDLPVAWLEEGYGDKGPFGTGYERLFKALRIANALWALRWYALTSYTAGVERAATRLRAYFAEAAI
jgi:aminoglycoside phosphotransferase (APT) family kinase protein